VQSAIEPFVSADEAARFLAIKRRHLLALARRGMAGAYSLGTGTQRKMWVFRLSELAASVTTQLNRKEPSAKRTREYTIPSGSPR
jgi:hypothetical protein